VITVSSAARAEGKTTMAVNLAASLSRVESGRVLLLDGDVPAPGIHHVAGVRSEGGLIDVLRDGLSLEGRIHETVVPRLDVLPCEPGHLDPETEGLLSQHCAALLPALRNTYSFVLIDTPPVSAGSEACLFGKHSDGVLLVVQLEKTSREVVRQAIAQLQDSGAAVLGCVLTQRKHHVPDIIYRMFGTPRSYYYGRYGYSSRRSDATGRAGETPAGQTGSSDAMSSDAPAEVGEDAGSGPDRP
jgi:capsular exopolysaccharide synthesis family protein